MSDFSVRSDSVNVEQIMEQVRARIREKRGVDYTEQQIRELAAVKLEKFLDPRVVRSDMLQQFQRAQAADTASSNITFGPNAIFESPRPIVAKLRRWLRPVLKMFFNPDPISQALVRLGDIDPKADMYYEILHNLVLELTRTSIEVKNLKMRVESLTGRLEFNERRARALESVVAYASQDEAAGGPPPAAAASSPGRSPASDSNAGRRGSNFGGAARSSGSGYGSSGGSRQARPERPERPDRSIPPPQAAVGPSASITPDGSPDQTATPPVPGVEGAGSVVEGPGQRSRRRRRRRGRRGGAPAAAVMGGATSVAPSEGAAEDGDFDAPDAVDAVDAADAAGAAGESAAVDTHAAEPAEASTPAPHDDHDQAGRPDPSGEQ